MTGPEPFAPITPLIAAHVACGVVAVVAGAGAMLAVKGSTRHRRFGLIYLGALLGLVLSAGVLAGEAWGERWHLVVLGVVALALASLGFVVSPRRRPARIRQHLLAMGGSYVVMLTAFYVDNGRRLPLWWRFPTWMLWIVPSIVGVPLLARAWRRRRPGRR